MTKKMIISNYNISVIKRLSTEKGFHFFDKDTMRFFNSRNDKTAILPQNQNHEAYFITSEQHGTQPRRYTLRSTNIQTGDTNTVGKFQQYPTHTAAKTILQEYCSYLWNDGELTLSAWLNRREEIEREVKA